MRARAECTRVADGARAATTRMRAAVTVTVKGTDAFGIEFEWGDFRPGLHVIGDFATARGLDPASEAAWEALSGSLWRFIVRPIAVGGMLVGASFTLWRMRNNLIAGGINNTFVTVPNALLRDPNTNAVIFAFGGCALFATSYYVVQRTCHTPLFAPGLAACGTAGAALLVPVMEELFWRSFLMRWIEQPTFQGVDPQRVGLKAVVLSTFVFMLAHTLWLAAIFAGLAYAWLYVKSGKLWLPVIAHAVTNGVLSGYVVLFGKWEYWM